MAHSFMELRNTLPSPGAPTKTGIASRWQVESRPGRHAVPSLLRGVVRAQQVAQFGAGHLALKLGPRQHGAEEAVLIEQHAFVERHVGDADGAFVAQRAIVAEDGHLVDRPRPIGIQAAVAVVVANRVGGAEVGDPTGFEQRDQPGLVLAGDRNGAGNRQGQRAAHADGPVENLVNAPQVRAAERRQAMREQIVESVALVHAADAHVATVVVRPLVRRRHSLQF